MRKKKIKEIKSEEIKTEEKTDEVIINEDDIIELTEEKEIFGFLSGDEDEN